jgi:hypothetical protein
LGELRFLADIERRVDQRLDPEAVELPPPATRWQKLERFLFSEGLVASLGGTSRLMYFAALLLIVPSLIGVCSGTIRQNLDDRIVQLDDLRLEFTADNARDDWEAAKRGLAQEAPAEQAVTELTEEEEDAIDGLASAAEARFARSLLSNQFELPGSQITSLRSLSVRQRLLRTAAQHAVSRIEVSADLSKSPHLDSAQKEAVRLVSDVDGKPRTSFGKSVATEFKDLASRSPSFRERLKTGLASFQKPARAQSMAHAMTRHAAGLVLDGGDGALGRAVEQALDTTRTRKTAAGLSEIHSRQFLQEVVDGKPISQSLDNLAKPSPFASEARVAELQSIRQRTGSWPQSNQILQRLENYPPGIDSLPEKHAKLSKAGGHVDDLVRDVTRPGQRIRGAQFADAVSQYRDWFPSYSGAERATIRGQLLDAWESNTPLRAHLDHIKATQGPLPESIAGINRNMPPPAGGGSGGGGGGTKQSPKSPQHGVNRTSGTGSSSGRAAPVRNATFTSTAARPSTRSSFVRARSFRGLRGFARVGGVLIGNEPRDGARNLDLQELAWEIDDDGVTLIVHGADGVKHRAGPFHPSIVQQSLAYAADGRPLAVTMVTASPLSELRILLHPALIDTPLGARVIEIDRFVDIFTGESVFRQDASALVHHSIRLYEYALALRLTRARDRILSLMTEHLQPDSHPVVRQNLEEAESTVTHPAFQVSVQKAISQFESLKDPLKTPLKGKPEFFDQRLVDAIISAAENSGGDVSRFDELFYRKYANALESPVFNFDSRGIGDASVDTMIQWFNPAPTFEIWSGVREKEFGITLDELLPSATGADQPLDFMLQVAFTSLPEFVDAEIEEEDYSDEKPWEFPSIAEELHETVLTEVEGNDRYATILRDVSAFTRLQRFFRMAIDGHFGEAFPIERLGDLQDICIESAPLKRWRTLRWNSRDGSLEASLRAEMQETVESPLTRLVLERLEENFAIREERSEAVQNLNMERNADQIPDVDWATRWTRVWDDADKKLTTWEDEWVKEFDGKEFVASEQTPRAIRWFTNVVQIRRSLGISVDDAQSRLESQVPLPEL